MRHRYNTPQLGRNTDERRRLIRGLIQAFLTHGTIVTTRGRARVLTSRVDKLVTLAKRTTSSASKRLLSEIGDVKIKELFTEKTVPLMNKRTSGYTRHTLLADRRGDGSTQVRIDWVDKKEEPKRVVKTGSSKETKALPAVAEVSESTEKKTTAKKPATKTRKKA